VNLVKKKKIKIHPGQETKVSSSHKNRPFKTFFKKRHFTRHFTGHITMDWPRYKVACKVDALLDIFIIIFSVQMPDLSGPVPKLFEKVASGPLTSDWNHWTGAQPLPSVSCFYVHVSEGTICYSKSAQ